MTEPRHWVWNLSDEIVQAQDRHYDAIRNEPRTSHQSNRASALGHPCLRFLVLSRTEGHRKKKIGRRLAALFRAGKRSEPQTKAILSEMGFDFWGGDQVSWPANDWQITGHVDGIYVRGDQAVIPELKRTNDSTFNRINHWEDFQDEPEAYFYRWYCQLILYILLAQSSEQFTVTHGLFILRSASDGWLKPVPVPMNWDLAEFLVGQAESINDHVEQGTLPDYCTRKSVCKRCMFYGDVCNPPMDHGAGVSLVVDQWVIDRFDRLAKLETAGREWTDLDKWARAWAKDHTGTTDRTLMIGGSMVEVAVTPTKGGIQRRVKIQHPEET